MLFKHCVDALTPPPTSHTPLMVGYSTYSISNQDRPNRYDKARIIKRRIRAALDFLM